MVSVCCCQCDPRLAAYCVAILSFLHFLIESMLLFMLDDEHRLVAEDSGIKFYTVFMTSIFLVCSSVFLFMAACYLIRFLCIPWLIGSAFHLLIYITVFFIILLRLFNDFSLVEAEKIMFVLFQTGAIIYAMWIVYYFMMELDEFKPTRKTKERSMFKLYSETEPEDDEEDLFPKRSKSRVMKMFSKSKTAEDKQPLIHN